VTKLWPNQPLALKGYSNELDMTHVRTKEIAIDSSRVPADVKVDKLLDILQEIDFTDVNALNYMSPSARQEGFINYTPKQLKENLTVFVNNIKGRVAFTGTPRESDVPRLMAFYQQLEDAVRLSIHQVDQKLVSFRASEGDDTSNYTSGQKQEYKNIAEDRSRLAIDLAIAGAHCGARYLGDAMQAYYGLYGQAINEGCNLEDELIEILAHKRKEIAEGEIAKLGTDVHVYTNYMQNLGEVLAIKGTENIIEHLLTGFARELHLRNFFKAYTANEIISAIQERVKKSDAFRSKISDWLTSQMKEWGKHQIATKVVELSGKIQTIAKEENATPSQMQHLETVKALVAYLKTLEVALSIIDEEQQNLSELFALNEAKAWLRDHFKNLSNLELVNKKREIIKTFSSDMLGTQLLADLKNMIFMDAPSDVPLDVNKFKLRCAENEKVKKIRGLISLEEDSIRRYLIGEADLQEMLQAALERLLNSKFISHFIPEDVEKEGLSPALMEWLLVSHKILSLQKLEEPASHEKSPNSIVSDKDKAYIATVDAAANMDGRLITLFNAEQSVSDVESVAVSLLEQVGVPENPASKRYRFHIISKRDEVLEAIWNKAVSENITEVIAAAEIVDNSTTLVYPKWKQICLIAGPNRIASLMKNTLVKVALYVAGVFLVGIAAGYLTPLTGHVLQLFTAKSLPFIINNSSIHLIRVMATLMKITDFVEKNNIKLFFGLCLIRVIAARAPQIPYVSRVLRSINPWPLIGRVSFKKIVSEYIFDPCVTLYQNTEIVLSHIAERAERERSTVSIRKPLAVWKRIAAENAPRPIFVQ